MADKPAAPKRVGALDPDGRFFTLNEDEVDQLPDGARLLTKQEAAQRAVDERYDALPTTAKVLGGISTAASLATPGTAITLGADPNAPPDVAAYGHGISEGLTGGLLDAGTRKIADAVGGEEAGDRYAQQINDSREASPIAHGLGQAAGMVAGSVLAPESRAARAVPATGISTVGAAVEHGVEKQLAGLATKGALGRATATAASIAARGIAEGAPMAALDQASNNVLNNRPVGEKLYAATGHGALMGGGLGAILGFGGSLGSSGARAAASKIARAFGKGGNAAGEAAGELAAQRAAGIEVPFLSASDLEAGIHDVPTAESPFTVGGEFATLKPGGRTSKLPTEDAIAFRRGVTIDPDAGLRGGFDEPGAAIHPTGKARYSKVTERVPFDQIDVPPVWDETKLPDIRGKRAAGTELDPIRLGEMDAEMQAKTGKRFAIGDGIHRSNVALERGEPDILATYSTGEYGQKLNNDIFNLKRGVPAEGGAYRDFTEPRLIDAEAGISKKGQNGKFQGKLPTEDAVIPANRKGVRRVDMADVEPGALETKSPIKVSPEDGPAAMGPKSGGGIMDALHDPSNTARGFAQDQAWKAVGGGFGLQSTRYAKQAAKYFDNGTRDLGEIAIRHGLIDMGEGATTPLQSGIAAAKSGTPADILPKASAAVESVGRQLGEIADASGGRIHEDELRKAFKAVRDPLDRIAGNEHVVNAIDNYAESLGTKLRTAPDGTISVQDLLEQRKGLDQIVYNETKSLDPGRRVQALRDIRGQMEDLIEEAIDRASGHVPGDLKAKYKTLKRDFSGLRIIEEAAEDSAARASKAATFDLATKTAMLGGLFTGHIGAPVLAAGSKLVKERGNAAAAAFLTRAADSGMIETAVSRFNERVKRAAGGVLRDASATAPRSRPKVSADREAVSREQAREQVHERQKKAQAIVKWVADARANPQRVMDQVKEASAIVGRAAGPVAAESYTAATMRAISFIAAHIPIRERRDPLDPRSVPPMTFDEADRLIRAARYATKPETVYDDFERGIITPEGIRAANTFTPDDFKEFQLELQQHATNSMLKGHMLTQSQRLRLDKLLPYPAGPDFKQSTINRLQANLMKAPPEPTPANPTGGGAPPAPVDLKVQQSGFDAIEARLAS